MNLAPQDVVLFVGLAVATITDLRSRRIPNVLTFPMMALGIVATAATLDWPLFGVVGCAAAFVLHYPLFVLVGLCVWIVGRVHGRKPVFVARTTCDRCLHEPVSSSP